MISTDANKKPCILIVEDHDDIVEILQYNLSREGFELIIAKDGEQGLKDASQRLPALVLLDLMLPKLDGSEVCRRLKNTPATQHIPIIMLTAKGSESDIVLGLGLGADDYVVKPFSPKELVARIQSVLRRTAKGAAEDDDTTVIQIDDLTIDPVRHQVSLRKKPIPLTLAEFKLLRALAAQRGRVLTREQLLEKVSGADVTVIDRNIDVHIASLRKKLKTAGDLILTVRGVGYRFKD